MRVCVLVSSCQAAKVLISKKSSHQKSGGISRWGEWVGKVTAYKFDTCVCMRACMCMCVCAA